MTLIIFSPTLKLIVVAVIAMLFVAGVTITILFSIKKIIHYEVDDSEYYFLYNVNKIFTCYSTTEKLAL